VLLNGDARTRRFDLPDVGPDGRWIEVLHTACDGPPRAVRGDHVRLAGHSLSVLEWEQDEDAAAGELGHGA
jgi:hypothetical protein